MMKLFAKNKKKKDNKGFSLVELIVVIAIMAILAVALAPRLIHYLDKARKSNDNQVIDVAAQAIKSGIVDDKIYSNIKHTGEWFIIASGDGKKLTYATNKDYQKLIDEVANVVSGVGGSITLQSDDAEKASASSPNLIIAEVSSQFDFKIRLYYGTHGSDVATSVSGLKANTVVDANTTFDYDTKNYN